MKKFEIDGKIFTFSFSKFSELFIIYGRKYVYSRVKYDEKQGLADKLEQEFADKLGVQKSTIHSWKFGPDGPNDLETIINLANCLQLDNYIYLLKEETTKIKLTDLQLQSVKRIYDALVGFLHEFEVTGGFDMWDEEVEGDLIYCEGDIDAYIHKLDDKIHLVFRQEYFFLYDLPIYNELLNYMHEDLVETYDGKLGYGYRYDAISKGNPTTKDDYIKAMNKLNSIIEKYI